MPVSVDVLVALLTGGLDDDGEPATSRPHWSLRVNLAVRICELTSPRSHTELLRTVLGGFPADTLDHDPALEEAYERWAARRERAA